MGWRVWVFCFFFLFLLLDWKLSFWNSSATTKEKHTAAGWVVSWPGCTIVADFLWASKPDTHPAHIPSSRASRFKNLRQFLWSNQWLRWRRSPQLSFGGEYPCFHCERRAGVQLLLWCLVLSVIISLLKCIAAKNHFLHGGRSPLII